jgi:hypothetical protein
VTRLPHQPHTDLDPVAASILEPEVPAGGNKGMTLAGDGEVARLSLSASVRLQKAGQSKPPGGIVMAGAHCAAGRRGAIS